jgi:NodT family efflux transporter outer membrane factor (OMF) lipoprotein
MSTRQAAYIFAIGSLLVAGCTVGPNYKRPKASVPSHFGATSATQSVDVARWWTTFNDPTLNKLIDRAAVASPDLKLATARIREARALRGVVGADLLPTVNTNAEYSHSRSSENAFDFNRRTAGAGPGQTPFANIALPGQDRDLYQVGFDANWELDVFGGVRRSIEAARADVDAAVEGRRDTLVTLLAEVARNYVELRSFQRRLDIARSNLKVQQDTLELTQARLKGKVISELDVARSEAQVESTASEIPAVESQRNQAAHRLAVLLGQHPQALLEELLSTENAPIPSGPPDVPPGLPSRLLRRRPDVRRAERQLAAATARVGVAVADLFPRFSLTGSLGLQSETFHDLGNFDSRFYSVGPSVSWPIFDAGRIRQNIKVQNARQEQAAVTYEKSVLTALEDVENALIAHAKECQRRASLTRAVEANRRSVDMAKQLYHQGLTDFLNVLDAQRALFASEDQLAQSDRTISMNLVALYKSLGGGWEEDYDQDSSPTTRPSSSQSPG